MSTYLLETEEDFAAYFDTVTGHGNTATFTPSGGSSTSINIIINEEYVDLGDGMVFNEGTQPFIHAFYNDVPNIAYGDSIVVDDIKDVDGNVLKPQTSYIVINVEPDKTGLIRIALEEQ